MIFLLSTVFANCAGHASIIFAQMLLTVALKQFLCQTKIPNSGAKIMHKKMCKKLISEYFLEDVRNINCVDVYARSQRLLYRFL